MCSRLFSHVLYCSLDFLLQPQGGTHKYITSLAPKREGIGYRTLALHKLISCSRSFAQQDRHSRFYQYKCSLVIYDQFPASSENSSNFQPAVKIRRTHSDSALSALHFIFDLGRKEAPAALPSFRSKKKRETKPSCGPLIHAWHQTISLSRIYRLWMSQN